MTLQAFFQQNPRAALGLSGGVDSAYLLYAAKQCKADVQPYYIKTAFQPAFELEDAKRIAQDCGAKLIIIELDVLALPEVAANPKERCYHCKTALFLALQKRALTDGYTLLLDGTNASDDAGDRPGMRALRELGVCSPLQACGLTKPMIRTLSKEAGLFTWNKPAYACLATRIPTGTGITQQMLYCVEHAEAALMELGYQDIRVRWMEQVARLEVRAEDMERAVREREAIQKALEPYFATVTLDLAGR